jgi:hypothetical protein
MFAGITTLLGASDTATIQASIASARARFRAIPFKALDESALAQVTPPGRHPNYWCARVWRACASVPVCWCACVCVRVRVCAIRSRSLQCARLHTLALRRYDQSMSASVGECE